MINLSKISYLLLLVPDLDLGRNRETGINSDTFSPPPLPPLLLGPDVSIRTPGSSKPSASSVSAKNAFIELLKITLFTGGCNSDSRHVTGKYVRTQKSEIRSRSIVQNAYLFIYHIHYRLVIENVNKKH